MGLPKTTLALAIANYTNKDDNVTWATLRRSASIGEGGSFSSEAGIKTTINFDGKQPSFKITPGCRVQYTQTLTNNKNANVKVGARAGIADKLDLRVFGNVDWKVNDKLHVKVTGHYTASTSDLSDINTPVTYGHKIGGFATVSYQVSPHVNCWIEPIQADYNINKSQLGTATNCGITFTLK